MKIKKSFLATIMGLCITGILNAQELGKTYKKEVTIDGKTYIKDLYLRDIDIYDEKDRLVKEEGKNFDYYSFHTYEYNKKGDISKKINNGITEQIYEYSYDVDDNKIYQKEYTYDRQTKEYGKPFEWYYEYDSKGNKISSIMKGVSKTYYRYNSNNNLIYENSTSKFSNLSDTEVWYTYNSKGERIHDKTLYSNGNTWEEWYKYNPNGKLTQKQDSNGNIWIYEYDTLGNTIHLKNNYNGKWSNTWYGYEHGNRVYELKEDFFIWYEYEYNKDGSKVRYTYIFRGSLLNS